MPYLTLLRGFALAAALLAATMAAANALPGNPLARHFSSEETHASPSHFDVTTGANGELFVGNYDGVLHYDGVDWRLVPLPANVAARAVATGTDGLVYVGSYDGFGRLVRKSDGNFVYEELLTRAGLRGEDRHIGIVWDVMATHAGVWFHTEGALHFLPYDDGQARRWPLPAEVRSFYAVGDELWVRLNGKGVCRFEDGEFVLLPGGEAFADRALSGVVPREGWNLMVAGDGLFIADEDGIRRMTGAADQRVAGRSAYVAQALDDGSVVIGTQDGELLRIGADLQPREILDLGGFAIRALGLDREGGLWVATEGDLVRLSLPSPWSFLGQDHGLVGSPNDFEWYDGAVWLASSRGLQRMTVRPDGGVANERLPWTQFEAQALHASEGGLLVGIREGLLVLDPGARAPRRLYEHAYHGVYGLMESEYDPGLVYAATASDLMLLRRPAGRWEIVATIPFHGISAYGIEEAGPGELWLGDSRGPVQRWQLDLDAGILVEREVFDDARGLPVDADTGTSIFRLDGRIHAVSGGVGFRLDGDRFVPDQAPPVTLVDRPDELVVEHTPLGDFAFTTRQLWRRLPGEDTWQQVYPGASFAAGYSNLRMSRDGVLRVATWDGLLQYNPNEVEARPQPLRLEMERVIARGPAGDSLPLPTRTVGEPVQVPAGYGLSLRFGMVSMESGAEFRYLLHGVTPAWSDWTDRDLTIRALAAGDYSLEVQARTRNGRQAAAMNYRFRVEPRWYEQWWVLVIGLVALAALAVAITLWAVRQRTERYLAANRRLEARIAERTRELEELNHKLAELVTEDALTGVANRRALENGLRREWFRCLDQRRPLSVLMIDVDHFKAYNDTHGHLEGDVQLRGIAQRLNQQHDPQRELLARYGGEEFALLLPGVHPDEALRRAESIRAAIATSDAGMTVSVGVAGFVPDVQVEPDALLRRADAALYVAKRAGRNRVAADGG
ncbi:diguanylate cyclase [Arenimonas sp.]|uniref:ligand-binding sensor domain-containing diguanylate cyclase n=1 Tax=Arenimonas sp. TaxID=1872635 RepID=UPI0025BF234A|nr:diguanylate cyclase [Arenimonas sp.]